MKTVVWCVARETSPWNRTGNIGKSHIWLPNSCWKRHYSTVGKGGPRGNNRTVDPAQWRAACHLIKQPAGHRPNCGSPFHVRLHSWCGWLGNFLTTVKDFWTWNDQTLIQKQMCNEHKMFVKGLICVHFVWHLQALKHLGALETDLEYEWHCFLWDTLSFLS